MFRSRWRLLSVDRNQKREIDWGGIERNDWQSAAGELGEVRRSNAIEVTAYKGNSSPVCVSDPRWRKRTALSSFVLFNLHFISLLLFRISHVG